MKSQIRNIYFYNKDWWWFAGRHDLLSNIYNNITYNKVLEVGCGSGDNSKSFVSQSYYGIDISQDLIRSGDRSKNLMIGAANILPFVDKSFDIVVLLDILEHLDTESSALKEVHRVLKDDGSILILVPAFQFLWNSHDVLNEHKRRYTKPMLANILTDSFVIAKFTYWNFFLFFPIAISKILNKNNNNQTGIREFPKIINSILLLLLKIENKFICSDISLPIGITLLCMCKKKVRREKSF